jgi:N,N'-diacetyllegionaminate synthase
MKNSVLIIAEAGVNHNGSLDLAIKLVDAAADSGADFVKFQTFQADSLVSKNTSLAEYQSKNMKSSNIESQYEMLKSLEMDDDWYPVLIKRCNERKIKFLSTAFDIESADFLDKLGIPFFKIPSGEITNKLFLRHIAKKGKNIVLSTGMSTLNEIEAALEVIINEGLDKRKITILHCNTEYPTPMEDVNLLAMSNLSNRFGLNVGYSDHTLGYEVSIAAVALGASIIEKHFTINRNLIGPDHAASLEPSELKSMVKSIRNIEIAIAGSGTKEPSRSEIKNIVVARKSLHFRTSLAKGSLIQENDLIALRPGDGISPMLIDDFVGKKLAIGVSAGDKIEKKHFYD